MTARRRREPRKGEPKPWAPLFGFISILVFGGFAWVIAPLVRPLIEENTGFQFPAEWPVWASNAVLAFGLFLILFAIAMTVAAVLSGPQGDPRAVRTPARKTKRRRR